MSHRPSHTIARRLGRALLLLLCCYAILLWQYTFAATAPRLDDSYRLTASTGLHQESRFVYFLYYLGLFPVATELEEVAYSREGAERILEEHGESLVMEVGHTIRMGEPGKAFLYLPGAWMRGSPAFLSVRVAHAMAFALALVALFGAFWAVGRPLLGAVLVALLGSNPFQLYEVYGNENVFGWPITAGIAVLALYVPLLGRRPGRGWRWAAPVLAGALLGTLAHVRSEALVLLVSAGACSLALSRTRWRVRLATAGLLVLSFAACRGAWGTWFDGKFAQALRRVEAAGGHPYTGPRESGHVLWHPIWCGLGDFDDRHGYSWNDAEAYAYAARVLPEKYGVEVPEDWLLGEATWDEAGRYYKIPSELPRYGQALRDKVLGDVARDPAWYLGILARRLWRVLGQTTPARLSLGAWHAGLPVHGLVFVPLVGIAVWRRRWFGLKLGCFLLPLSATALLVYSGGGTPYYSCYHIVAAAVLAGWLGEWARNRLWRRRGAPRLGAAETEASRE
ncbi:MAG: hypothetical protein ACLF0G_06920 [Candidatus Brocadiia bacterium]